MCWALESIVLDLGLLMCVRTHSSGLRSHGFCLTRNKTFFNQEKTQGAWFCLQMFTEIPLGHMDHSYMGHISLEPSKSRHPFPRDFLAIRNQPRTNKTQTSPVVRTVSLVRYSPRNEGTPTQDFSHGLESSSKAAAVAPRCVFGGRILHSHERPQPCVRFSYHTRATGMVPRLNKVYSHSRGRKFPTATLAKPEGSSASSYTLALKAEGRLGSYRVS